MKTIKILMCSLLMLCLTLVVGCNKEDQSVDTFADINKEENINTGKGSPLTAKDVYAEIRKNQDSEISKYLLTKIMEKELNLTHPDNKIYNDLYIKYLNEKFNELFVDSGSYNFNGDFSEKQVVEYLKSETYSISCEGNYTSLLEAPFTCNYADYIEKELNYDIYLKLLKVKYIVEEKDTLIDKYKVRNIKYYSVNTSTSENDATREDMEKYVLNLMENNSIEAIAKDKKDKELLKIEEEFKKVQKPGSPEKTDDTNFTYLNKFTTCGNVRCEIEEGKTYQESQVPEYYKSEIVTKNNTEILYEAARNVLFSDFIEDYLYRIGEQPEDYKYYLISPLYINDTEHAANDIILFNNESGNLKYYLVEVEIMNSSSKREVKALAAEVLVDKVALSTVMDFYFGKSTIEIYDKNIKELFVATYGDYSKE